MWVLLIVSAFAGYGDAVDGHPSRGEREAHLWTNGVRIAPRAYADDYGYGGGSCFDDASFTAEQKKPHAPLAWHDGLADIARQHSEDMSATDAKDGGGKGSSLSHNSSDGTSFAKRVKPYYPGTALGENVAFGFTSPFSVVMGWMCSEGHRSNIMASEFVELGVGQADVFWTQDFGGRSVTTRTLNMGVHLEDSPSGTVTLAVDAWSPTEPVVAVLDGEAHDMDEARVGDSGGVYQIELPLDAGCHLYWFASGADRFPEEGAYGFGDCAFDDEEAGWVTADGIHALLPNADLDGDGKPDHAGGGGGGCAQAPVSMGWIGLLGLLAARRRRA